MVCNDLIKCSVSVLVSPKVQALVLYLFCKKVVAVHPSNAIVVLTQVHVG